MRIGKKEFDAEHEQYIMGILNVTPDSFSDGGMHNTVDTALAHAERMLLEGATIIDVGGESTRPGYTQISEEEEIDRVVPVIEALGKNFDCTISIDTYKANVAEASLKAGAHLVNDIWGLQYDPKMAKVIADFDAAVCVMHNRKEEFLPYTSFMENMLADLSKSLEIAKNAGIRSDGIMVDPGVGFAKTYEENLMAIRELHRLKELGYPILLGTSRKSVIGLTLQVEAKERVVGTCVTTVVGLKEGAAFFRVHDVKENLEAIRMAKAIYGC